MPELDDELDEAFPTPEGDDAFRDMRKAANRVPKLVKENAAQAAELAAYKQRVALIDAGLNLSPKQTAALFATHEGELDTEALQATAVELGFTPAPDADPGAKQREDALAVHGRMQATAGGAAAPSQPSVQERIKDHEARGEWGPAQSLKAQQLLALRSAT